MAFSTSKIVLAAVLAAGLAAGCKNKDSGPVTGGSISPVQNSPKKTSKLAQLKEGVPTISAIVAPGGNVDVRDRSTGQSVWAGTVKPNAVITVAPDGVYVSGLKKMALKN